MSKDGLNLRMAALLSQLAQRFPCRIQISSQRHRADAKNVWDLIGLIAMPDSELLLEAAGPQSQEALDCVEKVIAQPFGDEVTLQQIIRA
jgi:phosphotransferase system HPr (HPr) family protein